MPSVLHIRLQGTTMDGATRCPREQGKHYFFLPKGRTAGFCPKAGLTGWNGHSKASSLQKVVEECWFLCTDICRFIDILHPKEGELDSRQITLVHIYVYICGSKCTRQNHPGSRYSCSREVTKSQYRRAIYRDGLCLQVLYDQMILSERRQKVRRHQLQ